MVTSIISGSVVHEPSNTSALGISSQSSSLSKFHVDEYFSPVHVDDQYQSIESTDSIDARSSDLRGALLSIPYLQIAASSFGTSGSKLKICRPFWARNTTEGVNLVCKSSLDASTCSPPRSHLSYSLGRGELKQACQEALTVS